MTPSRRGEGLSGLLIQTMRRVAGAHGFDHLIAPVRPTWKERYPLVPIERYATWRRDDGLPFDPGSVSTNASAGASLRPPGTPRCSPRPWPNGSPGRKMAFPESGDYVIPGALSLVRIDRERDLGVHVEPNVWVRHDPLLPDMLSRRGSRSPEVRAVGLLGPVAPDDPKVSPPAPPTPLTLVNPGVGTGGSTTVHVRPSKCSTVGAPDGPRSPPAPGRPHVVRTGRRHLVQRDLRREADGRSTVLQRLPSRMLDERQRGTAARPHPCTRPDRPRVVRRELPTTADSLGARISGVPTEVQRAPSQWSASARPARSPTTQASVGELADTASAVVYRVPTSGIGDNVQLRPSQCSTTAPISPCRPPSPPPTRRPVRSRRPPRACC